MFYILVTPPPAFWVWAHFSYVPFIVWEQEKKKKVAKTAAKGKRSVGGNAPFAIPGALTGELSAYEKAREENIKVPPIMNQL